MNVRLSLAKRGDAAEIADMSRIMIEHGLPWTWDERRVRRCIDHSESAVLVARDGRRMAGFGIMEYLDVDAHLNLLAVRSGYRMQGVGRHILDWLEASARTAGIFTVRLEVRAGNDAALRFYRRLGYREAGKRRGYYSGREDALLMTHDLSVRPTTDIRDRPDSD